jgi:hypothetical protein
MSRAGVCCSEAHKSSYHHDYSKHMKLCEPVGAWSFALCETTRCESAKVPLVVGSYTLSETLPWCKHFDECIAFLCLEFIALGGLDSDLRSSCEIQLVRCTTEISRYHTILLDSIEVCHRHPLT